MPSSDDRIATANPATFPQAPDIEMVYAVPGTMDSVAAYYLNLTAYQFTRGMAGRPTR